MNLSVERLRAWKMDSMSVKYGSDGWRDRRQDADMCTCFYVT